MVGQAKLRARSKSEGTGACRFSLPLTSTTAAAMEACPPEVLEQIFQLTCQDGGYAGCALSATSRYIRNVSASVRYHSVALRGHQQIVAFCSLPAIFEGLNLHHLFLSLCESGESSLDFDIRLETEKIECMVRLLQGVTTKLQILALVIPRADDKHLPTVPMVILPTLQDFTVVVPRGYAARWPSLMLPKRLHGLCGQLSIRRVHVVTPGRLTLNTSHYATYAPNLVDLRVSSVVDMTTYREVSELTPDQVERTGASLFQLLDPLPKSTKRVLLYITPPKESNDAQWNALFPTASALAEQVANSGGERTIDFLEISNGYEPYDESNAYTDWLDVVAGGDGCWSAKILRARYSQPYLHSLPRL